MGLNALMSSGMPRLTLKLTILLLLMVTVQHATLGLMETHAPLTVMTPQCGLRQTPTTQALRTSAPTTNTSASLERDLNQELAAMVTPQSKWQLQPSLRSPPSMHPSEI